MYVGEFAVRFRYEMSNRIKGCNFARANCGLSRMKDLYSVKRVNLQYNYVL